MLSENIILQSAGSLSVAVMALLMLILQTLFFFRKPQSTWYAWGAAISFSALIYSVGIFLEYNTPEGPLNRFSGLVEYTAIICLIHAMYGFTFSFLGIKSKRYHPVAGVFHGLILILLWSTNYVVAENFTTRDFMGLKAPYVEPALGPLGPVFVLYVVIAGVIAMTFWIKQERTNPKHRIIFLTGISFWMLLGIHDGLASVGLPTLQYFMEYGFLGFAMIILWVVFNSHLEITAEEKYRVITEFANDCIMVIQDGKMVFTNPACCDLTGGPLTDSATGDFLDIVAPEDRKTVLKHHNTLREGGHTPNAHTVRIRGADREQRFVEITSSLIQYRNRPAVLSIMRDITKRKCADEALRESEEKYRNIFSSATDTFLIFDDDGNIVEANPQACEMYGYSHEELVGLSGKDIAHPDYHHLFKKFKKDVQELGEFYAESVDVRKDGSLVNIEIRGGTFFYKGKHHLLAVVRDISNQKKMAAQLQRAQKMEAIGMLAGGVAHDLNNILGGLVSYPQLLLLQLPEDSPFRKSILTIQKSGEKAAAVVQDLLTLARRGVVVTEVVNLNDVIAQYQESPEYGKLRFYHPGVHIKTHLATDTLNILGSSTHLSKTVMNLVSNAAEAMPEGGKLTVSTKNRYVDRPIRGYDNIKEGDYVVLSVSDTGTGIAPDDMTKIFEPFYTKKKMGKSGTGLGMAVVWGTVKDHNGYIDAQSTEGKGTTFTLYFPVTRKESPEDKSDLTIESYSGNGESILIVDDVEEQRNIASGMLKALGYATVSVSSGEKAVEYLNTHKIDLLVLDMIMDPGMDGLDTYKNILNLHPGQKAIIASGFSETDRVKQAQRLGAGAYIRKPLLLEKIGLAVKKELEK